MLEVLSKRALDTKKLSPKKMKEKKICQPAKIAKLIKVKRRKLEAAGV